MQSSFLIWTAICIKRVFLMVGGASVFVSFEWNQLIKFIILYFTMDEEERQEKLYSSLSYISDNTVTIGSIIDSIEFSKKTKAKSIKTCSQTDSISSSTSFDNKQKSKIWTPQQVQLFGILLRKYGTDFHILSAFFPKKTKNQLKNRYKLYINMQKKRERVQCNNLKALSSLFKEVEQIEQKQQKQEQL